MHPRPGETLSRRTHLLAFAGLGLALAAVSRYELGSNVRAVETQPPPEAGAVFSLLAVGDTGRRSALPRLRAGQLSVARGMAAEDLRYPVDALLLLGDVFYPDGLHRDELVGRVRDNLVLPYCRFADLAGPRSAEVADVCDEPEERRHPVPIFAVAGNHDYDSRASVELERRRIPEFLSNWRMYEDIATTVELSQGLSLVLVDTPRLIVTQKFDAVREAVRRARGPWRILAAHQPVAPGDEASDLEWCSKTPPLEHFGVPGAVIHLYLAGHRHNLQVIQGQTPGPALHVIAGSGASVRPVRHHYERRLFALEHTGFARVDLVGSGDAQRLVVSLYAMPRYPIFFWVGPHLVSRWSIDRSGAVRSELAAPRG